MLGMMPHNKKISTLLLDDGGKVGSAHEVQEDNDVAMESVAEKIFKAIETKDKKMLIEGLEDAFAMMDSEPHEEGPALGAINGDIG